MFVSTKEKRRKENTALNKLLVHLLMQLTAGCTGMIHVKCWVSQVGYNNQVEYKHDPFFWPEMFHPSSCVNSYAGLIVITRSDDLYHDVCVCVCVCAKLQVRASWALEVVYFCPPEGLWTQEFGGWGWEGQMYAMTVVAVYVYMHVFTQVCTLWVCNQFGVSCQSLSNKYWQHEFKVDVQLFKV